MQRWLQAGNAKLLTANVREGATKELLKDKTYQIFDKGIKQMPLYSKRRNTGGGWIEHVHIWKSKNCDPKIKIKKKKRETPMKFKLYANTKFS